MGKNVENPIFGRNQKNGENVKEKKEKNW